MEKDTRIYLKRLLNKIFLLFILVSFFSSNAYSQIFSNISVAFGISSAQIIGDNPATKPFVPKDTASKQIYGGRFSGPQPGIAIKVFMHMDESRTIEIPLGFEYNFYRGTQTQPDPLFTVRARHEVDVATLSLGLNYTIYEVGSENLYARFYTGFETRLTFIGENIFTTSVKYKLLDSTISASANYKDAAMRIGASLVLGFDGQIDEHWGINTSIGFGIVNFNRDDDRGELFTVKKVMANISENVESTVFNMNIIFMIKYRL